MSWNSDYDWRRYVSMPERRRAAARKIAGLKKTGREVSPVEIAGRKIAATFWGQAWCKNLEGYSDYSNRLPQSIPPAQSRPRPQPQPLFSWPTTRPPPR